MKFEKKCLPHDVLGVAGVVSLGFLLPVVQDRDGGHVVEQLAGRQHPQVPLGVDAAVAVTGMSRYFFFYSTPSMFCVFLPIPLISTISETKILVCLAG